MNGWIHPKKKNCPTNSLKWSNGDWKPESGVASRKTKDSRPWIQMAAG